MSVLIEMMSESDGIGPGEVTSLSRVGDRDLCRALHTAAITRLRCHEDSRDYEAKRVPHGKTLRDIRCSLKRILARRFYRIMQAATRPAMAGTLITRAA
jgi:transposase